MSRSRALAPRRWPVRSRAPAGPTSWGTAPRTPPLPLPCSRGTSALGSATSLWAWPPSPATGWAGPEPRVDLGETWATMSGPLVAARVLSYGSAVVPPIARVRRQRRGSRGDREEQEDRQSRPVPDVLQREPGDEKCLAHRSAPHRRKAARLVHWAAARSRLIGEAPVAHRHHPVRARRDLCVMGDDDERETRAVEHLEQPEHPGGGLAVKVARRLVGENERWPRWQGLGRWPRAGVDRPRVPTGGGRPDRRGSPGRAVAGLAAARMREVPPARRMGSSTFSWAVSSSMR